MGGRVRLIISAGAPVAADIHWFLRVCFCFPVIQVYGLTETCGGGAWLPLDHLATERAGAPIPAAEVKLVDVQDMLYLTSNYPPRGEIWIRGPCVTKGYFNNEKKTAENFKDGWFKTEDIGELHEDGTISIIDRISNLVKLSHGEYIALERMESKYKSSELVEQIMVYADSGKDYAVALVVPDHDALRKIASSLHLENLGIDELCSNKEVEHEVVVALQQTGKGGGLKPAELIKRVLLAAEPWTTENGFLTAAQKLKRKDIHEHFKEKINHLYEPNTAAASSM